jgi:hypothetical protein
MDEENKEEKPQEEIKNDAPTTQIDNELKKVRTEGKTELEKAIFTRNKIDKRIAELQGENVNEEEEDDNKPLTIGDFKKIEMEKAIKTAEQKANEIEDDKERELTLHYLRNSIKPSGNAETDLRNARAIVNSLKNAQIVEELARKTNPNQFSKGSGDNQKYEENFEPTAEELQFMKPPFNLTKAEIIAKRPK